ncbi:MAG: pyrimidine dimer DNA glycosylase/endonuclease V [Candidatus Thorarchaeota archaeon]
MQTFLPFSDFTKSFKVLDWKRLGKQRVEALTIIKAIESQSRNDGKQYKGWSNHPCVIMWRKYVPALKQYHNLSILEWEMRGYNNNMSLFDLDEEQIIYPHWLGFPQYHASHRANLLRKYFIYYSQYRWEEQPSEIYVWLDAGDNWYYLRSGTRERIYLNSSKGLGLESGNNQGHAF